MEALQKQGELIRKLWNDENLKNEFKSNPKAVLERELGVKVPDDYNMEVLEETKDKHYFVIPVNPAAIGSKLDDAELEQVAGGTFTLPVAVIVTTVMACKK